MRDERRRKLESYYRGPALLSNQLRNFPKRMWLYRPSKNRWSIHEIIHHVADSEATGYVQCRMFIAEPGSKALRANTARWANSLGYFHRSVREALKLIHHLRKATYELLVNLPENTWFHSVENSNGILTYLEHWLDEQELHIPHHLEQIRQNYEEWLKNQTGAPQHVRPSKRIGPAVARPRHALKSTGQSYQ